MSRAQRSICLRAPMSTPTRCYERAAADYAQLTRDAFELEAERSLYFYRLRMDGHGSSGLPGAFPSTSTTATSSRNTNGHGATRKTIAPGTCLRSARRPAPSSSPIAPPRTSLRSRERVTVHAPLIDFVAPDDVQHALARGGDDARRTRRRLRTTAGALHRRWSPPRRQRRTRSHRTGWHHAYQPRERWRRLQHRDGGCVPARSGAGAPGQPRRQRPGGSHARRVSRCRGGSVFTSPTVAPCRPRAEPSRCISIGAGSRSRRSRRPIRQMRSRHSMSASCRTICLLPCSASPT